MRYQWFLIGLLSFAYFFELPAQERSYEYSERCLFSFPSQERIETELAKELTKISKTNISLISMQSLQETGDPSDLYSIPDMKQLDPQLQQNVLIEQFGNKHNIHWVFQINQDGNQLTYILYSLDYPIYIGISFNISHYVKPNKKQKALYTPERLAKQTKLRALEVLDILWQYWPLFAKNRLKLIDRSEIEIPIGYANSDIHPNSHPIIISMSPVMEALKDKVSLTDKKVKIPVLLDNPPMLINRQHTLLGGESVKQKILSGHIQDEDIFILTDHNLLIEKQENQFYLKWGVVALQEPYAIESSRWKELFKWNWQQSSYSPMDISSYRLQTGVEISKYQRLLIVGEYLINEDWRLFTEIKQTVLPFLVNQQSVTLGSDYVLTRPLWPIPSVAIGGLFRWDHLSTVMTDNRNILNVDVSYLNDFGFVARLLYQRYRHFLELNYSPRYTIGIDITGFTQRLELQYMYQQSYSYRWFSRFGYEIRQLEVDFYLNKIMLKINTQKFYASVGINF